MEEKKVTKISLSTVLLFFAIIAIIVMAIFIYKLINDKNTAIQTSTELKSYVNSLNGKVNDLQGKIDSITETINSSNQSKNITETTETKNNTTSESIAEDNTNDENKLITTASPFGFAGCSLHRVRLYANGDAYHIIYNGDGFDEKDIVHNSLIAKNVEDIEPASEENDYYVILRGKKIEKLEDLGWTKFQNN